MYLNAIHNLSLMMKVIGSLLIIIMITILHVVPFPSVELESMNSIDKVIHIVIFYIAGLWFLLMVKKNQYILVIILLIIYSLAMEFLQNILSYRSFEWSDWLSDIFGLLLSFFHLSKKL